MLSIERAFGSMLGADFLFAQGLITEFDKSSASSLSHRFWSYQRRYWRTDRSDSFSFLDGPEGSLTLRRGRQVEQASTSHSAGFHLAERLLCPIQAPIWGRFSDDWIMRGPGEVVDSERFRVELLDKESNSTAGHVVVDSSSGRLEVVETEVFLWRLEWFSDESDESPLEPFSGLA